MRKVVVFNNVTLDGYFSGIGGDISWAHKGSEDAEWDAFVAENASTGGMLLLGRVTYELMASYWPTPAAMKTYPDVAEGMNNLPKVVFSRTLEGVVAPNEAGEGRPGGGSTSDEERGWRTYRDSGKRQHRFAIGAGGLDR